MRLESIPFELFVARPHYLWATRALLLASGEFAGGEYNAMTVGWGSFGTMWGRPFAQVVVRPGRFTYGFMNRYDTFTLSAFPEQYHDDLQHLGKVSGRDGDKFAATRLTPVAASLVAAPAFAEAELVVECRKTYWQDMDPTHFLDPKIQESYPDGDYHRIFFGEIVALRGTPAYRS